MSDFTDYEESINDIAIVGMAGRFPKSKNVNAYWENIINSRDCISRYGKAALMNEGIDEELLSNPNYVLAKGKLDDIDLFDAEFFQINRNEAELMDPQHRMLLECAHEALEDSGYNYQKYDGKIGIFAGQGMDFYLICNVYPKFKWKTASLSTLQAALGNDKDSLTTTISYKLNLKGPGITIQSSSSTSLVSVCIACQGLMTYQYDMALAGGIAVIPSEIQEGGYLYEEGGIVSPDGYCRPFDAKAKGFVSGYGQGLVILKRLEDAILSHDNIYAVIKGWAINNDGSSKVNYSAPSVDAQTEVILEAQAMAGVPVDSIAFIEAHGTGTAIGDPIEVAALTEAFRVNTDKKQFCAIGSVKSNIGHLDTAAGIAGLIKTCLSLKHGVIPPSLHFKDPNPKIDFENSPFYVNTELRGKEDHQKPFRAGITSLGMGGTNAHLILEEPPVLKPSDSGRLHQLLVLSAQTKDALLEMEESFKEFLEENNNINLPDAAYTLQVGRCEFKYRTCICFSEHAELINALGSKNHHQKRSEICEKETVPVVFMFNGQAETNLNKVTDLYENEHLFQKTVDECCLIIENILGEDLKQAIVFKTEQESNQLIHRQLSMFVIQYSLAKLWMAWGVNPESMVGYGLGEYIAACLSGVFSLKDGLIMMIELVRLIEDCPRDLIMEIGLTRKELAERAGSQISICAVKTPHLCVVSGSEENIKKLEIDLKEEQVSYNYLNGSQTIYPLLTQPKGEEFKNILKHVEFKEAQIPFISGYHGGWIEPIEAAHSDYWIEHLLNPWLFSEGMQELMQSPNRIILEMGAGDTLEALTRCYIKHDETIGLKASLPRSEENSDSQQFMTNMLGQLWLKGVAIHWESYHREEIRNRISLPLYPFQRKSYWIPAESGNSEQKSDQEAVNPPSKANAIRAEDVESIVTKIWCECLGKDQVDRLGIFFEMGGDSVIAVQMNSRLNEVFQDSLEIMDIFNNPTIELLSKFVSNKLNPVTDNIENKTATQRKKARMKQSQLRQQAKKRATT